MQQLLAQRQEAEERARLDSARAFAVAADLKNAVAAALVICNLMLRV